MVISGWQVGGAHCWQFWLLLLLLWTLMLL